MDDGGLTQDCGSRLTDNYTEADIKEKQVLFNEMSGLFQLCLWRPNQVI